MEGPYVEIRLVDRKGNLLKDADGDECVEVYEFETLSDTIGAYATAVERLNEEFREEEEEEDENDTED